MSLKAAYEILEKSEEGKTILEAMKAEVDKMKDADAKVRKAEADMQKLKADISELSKIKEAVEAAGIDINDPKKIVEKAAGKTEAEKELEKLQKQFNAMAEKLEKEQKARELTEQRARAEKLRNDFGGALREIMGKPGELLAENLINRGHVKLDDAGVISYEVGDKSYAMDAAIEVLKVEHKDLLTAKPTGSNLQPPGQKPAAPSGVSGKTAEELDKMSPTALFALGGATA